MEIQGNSSNQQMQAAARHRNAIQIHQDMVRMSLKKTESIPEMLTAAPLIIGLMGPIRVIGFSDAALDMKLRQPMNGFKHLKYDNLAAALTQIFDETSDAFHCASKMLFNIRSRANLLFGADSYMNDIFVALNQPDMTEAKLKPSVDGFRKHIDLCGGEAREMEEAFTRLIAVAREVNDGMADGLAGARQEERELHRAECQAKAKKAINQRAVEMLEEEAGRWRRNYEFANKQFEKTVKKGEWSALGFGTVADLQGSVMGAVNAAVGIVKEAPKVVIAAVQSVEGAGRAVAGLTGAFPDQGRAAEDQRPAAQQDQDPRLGPDPGIENQLGRLAALSTAGPRQVGEADLGAFRQNLQDMLERLGSYPSKDAAKAGDILRETIGVVSVLQQAASPDGAKQGPPEEAIGRQKETIQQLLRRATELSSYASSQPGCGFGLEPFAEGGPDDSGFDKMMRRRHQKLVMTRAAMKEAQRELKRNLDRQLEANAEILNLGATMKHLRRRQASVHDAKDFLRKAIEAMTKMQQNIRGLSSFFELIGSLIRIDGAGRANRALTTMAAGVGNGPPVYHATQRKIIHDALIVLRAHFGFVVKQAELYEKIAQLHINPALKRAASISLDPTSSQQQEAQDALQRTTIESVEAIRRLALDEYYDYSKQFETHFREIDKQIGALPPAEKMSPKEIESHTEAVEAGLKEAREDAEKESRKKNVSYLSDMV